MRYAAACTSSGHSVWVSHHHGSGSPSSGGVYIVKNQEPSYRYIQICKESDDGYSEQEQKLKEPGDHTASDTNEIGRAHV